MHWNDQFKNDRIQLSVVYLHIENNSHLTRSVSFINVNINDVLACVVMNIISFVPAVSDFRLVLLNHLL